MNKKILIFFIIEVIITKIFMKLAEQYKIGINNTLCIGIILGCIFTNLYIYFFNKYDIM